MGTEQLFRGAYESEAEVESAMDSLAITVTGSTGTSGTPHVVDENRLRQIEFVVRTLGFLARESGVQVNCESRDGITEVCADVLSVVFPKPSWLARCSSISDGIRVVPSSAGITVTFTFNGILPEAEQEVAYD